MENDIIDATRQQCLIPDCDRDARHEKGGRLGWCQRHYRRNRLYGDPLGVAEPKPRKPASAEAKANMSKAHKARYADRDTHCLFEGCPRPRHARGYCAAHYAQKYTFGIELRDINPYGGPRPETPEEKLCFTCGIVKPRSEFTTHSTNRDGLSSSCRECKVARQRQRRAEDPEKARAAAREDYRKHKDRYQAYAIKYDRNAMIRLWKKENKDLVAEYGRQRRARMYETEIERIETQVVADRDEWICYLCDDSVDPTLTYPDFGYRTIDHVIPLSRGGTHTYDNIKLAHWICNIRKGASILGEEDSKRTWVSRDQDPPSEAESTDLHNLG